MEAYQQRVVDEKAELDAKMVRLHGFIAMSPVFAGLDSVERVLLHRQGYAMRVYSEILGKRIAAFTAKVG